MSAPSKQELVDGLEGLRKRVCAYVGGKMCDCKYGAHKPGAGRGEQGSGCQELRGAIGVLNAISEQMYDSLTKRSRALHQETGEQLQQADVLRHLQFLRPYKGFIEILGMSVTEQDFYEKAILLRHSRLSDLEAQALSVYYALKAGFKVAK